MLCAGHTIMLEESAPGLPYDAQVQYLESTGTQWIDTGITPNQTTYAKMRLMNMEATGDVILGYQIGSDVQDWRFFNANGGQAFMDVWTSRCNTSSVAISAGTWYELEVGNLYVKNLLTDTTIVSGNTVGSFTGTSTITLNKHAANSKYSKNRWSWLQIYNNGVIVRDYIAVRVGQTGYLYDRANPTGGPLGNGLYGNAADGQGGKAGFPLACVGPDI